MFVFALASALSLAASLGAAHIAAGSIIEAQQNRQLTDLAVLALRRTEAVVNQGSATLQKLVGNEAIDCAPISLQNVRFAIYESGQIKDIRIGGSDAAVRCSAFPETLEFDKTWPRFDEMLPVGNSGSRLFLVDQFSGSALGILWQATMDTTLIGIVSINTAILDVMPAQLHDASIVSVALSDDTRIAHYASASSLKSDGTRQISVNSAIYPLKSVIRVSPSALAGWNTEVYFPIMALAAALGAAVGLLMSRLLAQPNGPVAELDRAIADDEFKPFYQPIFELRTGAITGCEMLARWVKPGGEIISPARFIPLAESNGRIEVMTWQLLRKSLDDLGGILSANRNFTLSVNVTPDHFMSSDFNSELKRIVAEAHVARAQVCIEITEREPFADLAAAAANVAQLREDGFKIAIDDVGIGHSGLSHLQALHANTLKIDKFFVDTVEQDDTAGSIIQMLVRLAQRLDMQLVAEGIEQFGQVEALLKCGVTRGQGYIVSPPVPAQVFVKKVEAGHSWEPATGKSRVA